MRVLVQLHLCPEILLLSELEWLTWEGMGLWLEF